MTATATTESRTFRGRSLEEILPQVRAELGADAIVLRRREGLAGGVAGFFQRPYVEIDARAPLPGEADEVRNDRATQEGLASPAIQALVEQASPFADALTRAQTSADDILAAAAHGAAIPAGLYGPQPTFDVTSRKADDVVFEPLAPGPTLVDDVDGLAAETRYPRAGTAPAPPAPREIEPPPARHEIAAPAPSRAATTATRALVTAGLSESLAADVVAEATAHGLPFAQPRAFKSLVRTALARRMPVLSDLGGGPRRLAFVGAGGAGKTAAIAHLAAAYANADAEVIVVALRSADTGLAAKLEPLGVSVIAAAAAPTAARRLAGRTPGLLLVDTPAAGPGDRAAVAALAIELRALEVEEVHLALPATISAPAADELSAALAPLGVTHVALTHADQTARPGAPVELAISARRALSYVTARESIEPADPAALAKRLLP
jgi:flagellar biosynthesis GTPase FlhF